MNVMKLLMCNVAWMREYQGISDTDYPINGGEFIEENGYGHEVCVLSVSLHEIRW
jgi:hypothetical protein